MSESDGEVRGDSRMIFITGDCHGNFERFNPSIFPEQNEMTKEDYVIICGDFGGVWHKDGESPEEEILLWEQIIRIA